MTIDSLLRRAARHRRRAPAGRQRGTRTRTCSGPCAEAAATSGSPRGCATACTRSATSCSATSCCSRHGTSCAASSRSCSRRPTISRPCPYVMAAPPDPSIPDELHGTPAPPPAGPVGRIARGGRAGARAAAGPRAGGRRHRQADAVPGRVPRPRAGPGRPAHGLGLRAAFIDAFDDAVIDIVERRLAEPTTPWALVQLRVLGGAVGRVADDATAYGWRDRTILAWLITPYTDLANAAAHEAWTAGFQADLLRHGSGAYVNFMGDEPAAAATAYPATTWDRASRDQAALRPGQRLPVEPQHRPGRRTSWTRPSGGCRGAKMATGTVRLPR